MCWPAHRTYLEQREKSGRCSFLETIGLAGVPGEAFFSGAEGRQFIRFSYAKTDADIDDACRRIARLG